MRAPIFGISRLRMGSDGPGITTLVTFMGCPLQCKYCLNSKCHEPTTYSNGKIIECNGVMWLSPQELYDKVKIDNIYFQATGGGICFGGGEPGLQAEFIEEFRKICGNKWKISIETSLFLDPPTVDWLKELIDYWIIDIKTLDSHIFELYTGRSLNHLMFNLSFLNPRSNSGKFTVKVPDIPGYTTKESISYTISQIESLGYSDIRRLRYITNRDEHTKP